MKQVLFYIAFLTILVSCKKEIHVDLNNAPARIVIEGIVSNTSLAEVSITKSVQFSSRNSFPDVTGATVNITDDLGTRYNLVETTPGKYISSKLTGVPGRTYNLQVTVEDKQYRASSTMPKQVKLDTLLMEKMFMGEKSLWIVKPRYTDPDGFGNYYKFIETINGKRYPTTWVWDDRVINNGISTLPLLQMDSIINLHDTVEVEMQCIDPNVFRYFSALLDVQQNMTTPANPDSNISGGALGYFSAQTSERKKVVVR